jgi:hypothetical protein
MPVRYHDPNVPSRQRLRALAPGFGGVFWHFNKLATTRRIISRLCVAGSSRAVLLIFWFFPSIIGLPAQAADQQQRSAGRIEAMDCPASSRLISSDWSDAGCARERYDVQADISGILSSGHAIRVIQA